MEETSDIETKESLITNREASKRYWQERAEEDALRIERRETTLRDVLGQWAQRVFEKEGPEKTDALTRIFNKRTFEETLPRVIELCRRTGAPLGLMYLDIDDFKRLNDEYGHPIGDEVLKKVGKTLFNAVRPGDHPARVGGEELAVLLPGAKEEDLEKIAERVRAKVEKIKFKLNLEKGKPQPQVKVSVGATLLRPDEILDSFKDRADKAMYQAKQSGKNRICIL